MMRSFLSFPVLASCLLFWLSSPAAANTIYTLEGVTLEGGGTLTGGFSTNDARTTLVSYDITASANGNFLGFEYTPANSSALLSSNSGFIVDDLSFAHLLDLFVPGGLQPSGASPLASGFLGSYEEEFGAGFRNVTAGSAVTQGTTSVPDTGATALLLSLGVAGLFGARRLLKTAV